MFVCLSVRLSVTKTHQLLRIMSICHYAYILISKMFYLISQISQISDLILNSKIFSRECNSRMANVRLSVSLSVTKTPHPLRIVHISHNATQSPCPPPLGITTIGHHAYQPSCPYSLLTYALLSQLLSHFGLLLRRQQQ